MPKITIKCTIKPFKILSIMMSSASSLVYSIVDIKCVPFDQKILEQVKNQNKFGIIKYKQMKVRART